MRRPTLPRPSRQHVAECLERKLKEMKDTHKKLDVITFSGNGEPTTHPDFEGIVDDTIRLRNRYFPAAKVSVLSNSTMAHLSAVHRALERVDNNILKLDTVDIDYIRRVDRPTSPAYNIDDIISTLRSFHGNVIIQTMFMKGTDISGQDLNNTSDRYVTPWIEALKLIRPMDSNVMVAATKAIKKTDGIGIPTVKPWNLDVIAGKMEMVHESKALAVAMDIDAAGLPFLKNMEPPAGSKTVEELRQIAKMAGTPFIVKGVMTVKGALKAKEAGASAIVVSNHGGRVLDQCPATAEVLEEIALAVGDSMKIFVDGGIRSGVDVFKALALGADAVIIARPFVTAVYGGAEEGVKSYIEKLGTELEDTMKMCGVTSLEEIDRDCVWTRS